MLIVALKNSAEKKYHGKEEDLNAIPTLPEQVTDLQRTYPTILKYWNDKDNVLDKKDDEAFWRKITLERFRWIRDLIQFDDKQWTPAQLAKEADSISANGNSKADDHLLKKQNQYFKLTEIDEVADYNVYQDYNPNFTWLQLFCKLDFENYLGLVADHADLKVLHQYIHAVSPYVTNLYIKSQYKRNLKSGYYYWMIVIGRLNNLQTLIIDDQNFGYFNQALKYVVKGFKYFFRENKGSLKKIVFRNMAYFQEDKLSACLRECPDLESLHFIKSTLNLETCKTIGKILSDYKNVRELDLSYSNINQTFAKEIADGLMRAK